MGLEDIDPELEEKLEGGGEDEVETEEIEIPLVMVVDREVEEDEDIEELKSRLAARYQGILNGKRHRNVRVIPYDDW